MTRKPIGLSIPYREVPPKSSTIAALEKQVKQLTKRVEELEKQLKENK